MPKKNGFAPIIALVVILLVIGGIWLGILKVKQSQTANPVYSPSSTVDTTNWKTYSNNIFSLKYPSDWTVTGPIGDPGLQIAYLHAPANSGQFPDLAYFVYIYKWNSDKFPGSPDPKEVVNYEQLKINNYAVLKTDQAPSRFGAIDYLFKRSDGGYIGLGFTPYDKMKPYQNQSIYFDIFNQILSTFKFN